MDRVWGEQGGKGLGDDRMVRERGRAVTTGKGEVIGKAWGRTERRTGMGGRRGWRAREAVSGGLEWWGEEER